VTAALSGMSVSSEYGFSTSNFRWNLGYLFHTLNSTTLFLNQVTKREYSDDAVRDLITATMVTTPSYSEDGVVHERVDDGVTQEAIISRSDVPLDINGEQVPEFGDWAHVSRWDRQPAD
jgi:hypothetical protein